MNHLRWTPCGKRRIHERPNHEEVLACRLWLEAEVTQIRPRILIAPGATGASALPGSSVRVTRDRAKAPDSSLAQAVTVTVHPSSMLRVPDAESRATAFAAFVDDLRRIVQLSSGGAARSPRSRSS